MRLWPHGLGDGYRCTECISLLWPGTEPDRFSGGRGRDLRDRFFLLSEDFESAISIEVRGLIGML